ncbi:MAG: helix-turn-helix domain-containing protein [Planctomycetota bacterium]|jgi:transcriptional regulator with XRE-family HTH domain
MPKGSKRFAAILRKARERSGLTQAALSDKCGLTGSYISLLESAKKPAPSDKVVRRLAEILSLDPERVLRVAHLDRAPKDLRTSVQRLRRQASIERQMRERTAEALFPLSIWSLIPTGLPNRPISPNTASLGANIVETFDRLVQLATSSPDLNSFRERSRKVLHDLPARDRRRVLEAAPELLEPELAERPPGVVAAEDNDETWTVPSPGLPPDVLPGDVLHLDPTLDPRGGDLVVLADDEGHRSVRRHGEDNEGRPLVVVEIRRRLR